MNLFDSSDFLSQNVIKSSFQTLAEERVYEDKNGKETRFLYLKIPKGMLLFAPYFFELEECQKMMNYFLATENSINWQIFDWKSVEKEKLNQIPFKNIAWQHDQIKIFGKTTFIPRFSAWYGEEGKNYSYSGLKLSPKNWKNIAPLLSIKDKVEKFCCFVFQNHLKNVPEFNSVLMNWYRDGQDSMGWHRDNEKELGQHPLIASVNFGTTRRFLLRNYENKSKKLELALSDGSLLIMAGEIQYYWEHAVPKQLKIKENRINLTFRKVMKTTDTK